MRIGVAGVGRIGAMHAANLTALPQVDEVLLYDPAPGRAEACVTAHTRAVRELDDLLKESDGVLVATPTDTHPALVRACLAAGTPVLCEKPIAASLDAMRELVDEIEKSTIPVLV